MTARFKVLLVVAVLFFALNVGGAGVALRGGELAHAGVHAALALLTAVEGTGVRGVVAYAVLATGAGLAVVGGVGAVRRSRAAGAAAFRSTLAAVALVVAGFLLAA